MSHHSQFIALGITMFQVLNLTPLLSSFIFREMSRSASRERARQDEDSGRSTRAHVNPKLFLKEDMGRLREELREIKYQDKVCSYCSTFEREIRHHHFSTTKQKEFTLKWMKGDFMCPICNKLEEPLPPGAASSRVILSDSTLYGIWTHPDISKNAEHFDIECVVGGRVRDMTRIMEKYLLCNSFQLEIIVVAGINNVIEGQDSTAIIQEFLDMKKVIMEHNFKYREKYEKMSYVSICTLCLPPKLCSFNVPDGPSLAEWKPGPTFVNKYPVIKQVNEAIKEMNMKDGINFLNLHMQGIKMLKGGPQHKYDTKTGSTRIWREREVFKKLHFTSENKQKLIRYLQNTFRSNEKRKEVLPQHS